MRVVLDTNFWNGIPSKILENWIENKFQLLITEEILQEYQTTLLRISKGKRDELVNAWAMLIIQNSIVVNVQHRFKLSVDPDDDKFVDCAVSGNARYIVSGDSHLLDLKRVMNIKIVKANEFFKELSVI